MLCYVVYLISSIHKGTNKYCGEEIVLEISKLKSSSYLLKIKKYAAHNLFNLPESFNGDRLKFTVNLLIFEIITVKKKLKFI